MDYSLTSHHSLRGAARSAQRAWAPLFIKNKLLARIGSALAAIIFAATTHTVHAQAGATCVPGGTVEQTNACAVQAFQTADTDNNILYGDVMRILSAHERPALRRDQNDWIRQRAATCKKQEAASEGRPDWTRRYHDCMVAETAKRKKELMVWLHEGPPPGALQKQ